MREFCGTFVGVTASESLMGGIVVEAKILLVDDDDTVLRVFGTLLEAEGYSVVARISAHEGLEELALAMRQDRPFDLLITDLDMPDHRGTVLIGVVRQLEDEDDVSEQDRLPILLLSAADMTALPDHERDDLVSLGVSYLHKDDAVDRLIPTVRAILHR